MIFTFIPNPTDDREYAFQQRVIGRGMTLVADGYTLVRRELIPGTYYVHTPQLKCYIVDVREGVTFDNCQCGCWLKNAYCKHMVACKLDDERLKEDAQVAELEDYARNHGLID